MPLPIGAQRQVCKVCHDRCATFYTFDKGIGRLLCVVAEWPKHDVCSRCFEDIRFFLIYGGQRHFSPIPMVLQELQRSVKKIEEISLAAIVYARQKRLFLPVQSSRYRPVGVIPDVRSSGP